MVENQNVNMSENRSVKLFENIKKRWYIFAGMLAVIIAIIVVISVANASKAAKVQEYIDGKIFLVQKDGGDYKAYNFSNGKIAIEEGFSYTAGSKVDGHVSGNINEFANEYKVKVSASSDDMWIMTKYPHGYIRTVAVCMENGVVNKNTSPEWKQVTLEELEVYREQECVCNHQFSEWVVKQEATATTDGQKQSICSKCGKVKTDTFDYKSVIRPSIKDLEENILTTYRWEWTKKETATNKLYTLSYGDSYLSVPNDNSEFALVLKLDADDNDEKSLMISTSTNKKGSIDWICVQGNFEFSDHYFMSTLIPCVFGEEYRSNNPLNVESLEAFMDKGVVTTRNGWDICDYECAGIKYQLKESAKGFYFYIYF